MANLVGDQFRENPLSLQPGGYIIKTLGFDNKENIYNKIKNPYKYVNSINRKTLKSIELFDEATSKWISI